MADPVLTQLASGNSTTATTTVNFTGQAVNTLLILGYCGDNYRTTSGSGRPESTGWTLISDQQHNAGHTLWYKITDGSDTSVQYTLVASAISSHWVGAATNIDPASPLDTSSGQSVFTDGTSYTTPAITPSAGRRLLVASMGGCKFNGPPHVTGQSTWLNSYTEVGDQATSSGSTSDNIGVAWVVLDGGASTSSGSTYSTTSQGRSGIIAAFKNAPAASNFSPVIQRRPHNGLIMRGRR